MLVRRYSGRQLRGSMRAWAWVRFVVTEVPSWEISNILPLNDLMTFLHERNWLLFA